MADTYDLAMQLFRVASEKQKIEKSQGKLKPEDEIQFTEASFNDFSQSLSREFSNLSPEEQKEAKRLLEYKINDNISEVISGNVNQGFSLNVQSVRNVISSAIEIVEQQNIAQSPQGNVSSIKQDQATNSYQSLLDNYKKTHNIDALYKSFFELSSENKIKLIDNLSDLEYLNLIDKRNSEYIRKSNTIYVFPDGMSLSNEENSVAKGVVSKEEIGRRVMEEFRNGTKEFLNILDANIYGVQKVLASENQFTNPRQDKRFDILNTILVCGELPPEMVNAVLSNKKVFDDFYSIIEAFARESIFRDIPPDKIDFSYLFSHRDEILNTYLTHKETVNSKFLSKYKQYERSEKYMSYSDKLIEEFGLSEDQLNVLNSNLELKTTYSDIVTCIFQKYIDTMDLSSISEENLKKYYQCFLQKLDTNQKDLFSVIDFAELIHQNIANGKIETIINEVKLPNSETLNILNIYDNSARTDFYNKSGIRRQNITQHLQSIPTLSNLNQFQIDQIVDLMINSYSSKSFINGNSSKTDYLKNIMFESYIEENLPNITQDKTVIDSIMDIVHKSNETQVALRYENSPLMGINYYLDDIQKMLGFKEPNNKAITRAIRLSATSSFPEELEFNSEKFEQILKTYGANYDKAIFDDPKAFSKVVSLIRTSHDRFMKEAIYSKSELSRETIDFFNFEKSNDSQKAEQKVIPEKVHKAMNDIKYLKKQYGVDVGLLDETLPSDNFSLFINFKDDNERKDFTNNLKSNKLFALEFTNLVRNMQGFVNLKGKTNFTQELLDSFKNTYFSSDTKELADALTLESMQGIFKLLDNRDVNTVFSLSIQNKEGSNSLRQFYREMSDDGQYYDDYLKKLDAFRQKHGLMDMSQLKASIAKDPKPRETNTNEQAKSDSVIDSQSFEPEQDIENSQPPAIQQGGLIGFINRFRNNFSNRNKNEGLIVGIKKAFINAKDNISEEVMDNNANDSHGLKEDQSYTDISQSPNTLDEMSKKLREGINVDNLGVQGVNNNKNRDSEQREAESEEEQL